MSRRRFTKEFRLAAVQWLSKGNQIARFIEKVYNHRRLHSALGYLPPVEFQARLDAGGMNTEAASRHVS